MGKMKFAAAIVAILALVGCAGGNGPTNVAQSFLDAISAMDFKKAQEFATDEGKSTLSMMEGMMGMVPKDQLDKEKGKKITIGKVTENGDMAVVEYTTEGAEGMQTLNLKKVSGVWKVDFKKDMGGGDSMAPADGTMAPAETK